LSESGFTFGLIEGLSEFHIVIEDLESVSVLARSVFLVVGVLELDELLLNVDGNTFFGGSLGVEIDD
jgi:hypothetical protein